MQSTTTEPASPGGPVLLKDDTLLGLRLADEA